MNYKKLKGNSFQDFGVFEVFCVNDIKDFEYNCKQIWPNREIKFFKGAVHDCMKEGYSDAYYAAISKIPESAVQYLKNVGLPRGGGAVWGYLIGFALLDKDSNEWNCDVQHLGVFNDNINSNFNEGINKMKKVNVKKFVESYLKEDALTEDNMSFEEWKENITKNEEFSTINLHPMGGRRIQRDEDGTIICPCIGAFDFYWGLVGKWGKSDYKGSSLFGHYENGEFLDKGYAQVEKFVTSEDVCYIQEITQDMKDYVEKAKKLLKSRSMLDDNPTFYDKDKLSWDDWNGNTITTYDHGEIWFKGQSKDKLDSRPLKTTVSGNKIIFGQDATYEYLDHLGNLMLVDNGKDFWDNDKYILVCDKNGNELNAYNEPDQEEGIFNLLPVSAIVNPVILNKNDLEMAHNCGFDDLKPGDEIPGWFLLTDLECKTIKSPSKEFLEKRKLIKATDKKYPVNKLMKIASSMATFC